MPTSLEEEQEPIVREDMMTIVAHIIDAVVEEMVSEHGESQS